MEQNKLLKFMIPPIVLASSIIWGAFLESRYDNVINFIFSFQIIQGSNASNLNVFTAIVTTGAISLALGYFIGQLSVFITSIIFFGKHSVRISKNVNKRIQAILGITNDKVNHSALGQLFSLATFHHALLPENLLKWQQRRWENYSTLVNCIVALLLAHVLGYCLFKLRFFNCKWLFSTFILCIFLLYNAYLSWREVMESAEFHLNCSTLKLTNIKKSVGAKDEPS